MTNLLKNHIKDFGRVFKERLIQQLARDLNITEIQEVKFRNDLGEITFQKSNNDKKIIATINHHVENLRYNNYQGGVENWDDVTVTGILNDYLVGTKLTADSRRNRDFFRPIEVMEKLINN